MVVLTGEGLINRAGFHVAETVLTDARFTFLHGHEFYEFFLVTKGSVLHRCNGADAMLAETALCLAGPGDVHQFKKGPCRAAHFRNLAVEAALFRREARRFEALTNKALPATGQHRYIPQQLVPGLLAKLAFLSGGLDAQDDPGSQAMLLGVLWDCLCGLQAGAAEQQAPAWLAQACEAIREPENYRQGLPRLIALSGKTQEHLTRSMQRYYNMPPSAYLNQVRLAAAAQQLRTTGQPVAAVMRDCGFHSASYFNQAFKGAYGLSPGQYRQRNRAVISPHNPHQGPARERTPPWEHKL